MRPILFRGIRIDNGEMVEGDLIHEDGCEIGVCHQTCHMDEGPQNAYTQYQVIPETVGQFTGLYDKDKKMVWEGDVVKWKSMHIGTSGDYHIDTIEYQEQYACFMIVPFCYDPAFAEIEVIGNRHQHKNILQEIKELKEMKL